MHSDDTWPKIAQIVKFIPAGDQATMCIPISHSPIREPRTYVDADEEKMLELRAACGQGSANRDLHQGGLQGPSIYGFFVLSTEFVKRHDLSTFRKFV